MPPPFLIDVTGMQAEQLGLWRAVGALMSAAYEEHERGRSEETTRRIAYATGDFVRAMSEPGITEAQADEAKKLVAVACRLMENLAQAPR